MGLLPFVRSVVVRHTIIFIAASVPFVFATPVRGESSLDWEPAHTRVFAVGLLEWKHKNLWDSFPEAKPHRRDAQLVKFFRNAGVDDERIVYLQDAEATKSAILNGLDEFLDDSRRNELLVFYFAGHGYRNTDTNRTYFANYDAGKRDDSGLSVTSIVAAIEKRFRGKRVWLIADCCHSGALYDEALKRRDGRLSYACLTSAYTHNTSTGAWTFTDSFLKALRGRPSIDYDGDGYIAWNETARYVEGEMAFVEGQKSMFTVTGDVAAEAKLSAVNGTAKPKAGFHCEAFSEGKWYKAEVLEFDAARSRYYVHYLDYDSSYDEWLPAASIRAYQPRTLPKGTKIDAYSSDDEAWYPATVRESWYGLHFVHYDGYDATWDEWVGPDCVRTRK